MEHDAGGRVSIGVAEEVQRVAAGFDFVDTIANLHREVVLARLPRADRYQVDAEAGTQGFKD